MGSLSVTLLYLCLAPCKVAADAFHLCLLHILFHVLWACESEVVQSWLTLCDPMDCSLPGFSVHGIFQARVREWGAISFSRGSS